MTIEAGRLVARQRNVLQEANDAVYGEREASYGHPRDDFMRIATLWTAYLNARTTRIIDSRDVACMIVLLKMARLLETPTHRDSWVDLAGYAAAGARAAGVDA